MAPKDIHQVYVTAHFSYIAPWAGEFASCGWRLGYVPKAGPPAAGQTFTPAVPNSHSSIGAVGADATWNWSQPWRGDWGSDTWDQLTSIAAANAVRTYFTTIAADVSNLVRLQAVKIALVHQDGTYAYPSAVLQAITPTGGGLSGSSQVPPELSVATTLRAPVLGRRGRGRWYLPSPGLSTSQADGGKLITAFRQRLANAGKALVDNFDAMGDANTDFIPIVGIASATTPTMIRPSEVRVGDHFDVQRRRQHQVDEVYYSVSL